MGSIRANVAVSLGPFFNMNINVESSVDDDEKEVKLSNVCHGIKDSKEHPLHKASGCTMKLTCKVCGNDDTAHFQKGQQVGDTWFVVDAASLATARTAPEEMQKRMKLTVHKTADLAGNVLPTGKAYFLSPKGGFHEAYAIFRALLDPIPECEPVTFLTLWAPRSKVGLYRLGKFETAITIEQLAFPATIRPVPAVTETPDVGLLAQAQMLARMSISPFNLDDYTNERAGRLEALIKAGNPEEAAPEGATPATPVAARGANALALNLNAALAAAQEKAQANQAKATTARKAAKKAAPRKRTKASA